MSVLVNKGKAGLVLNTTDALLFLCFIFYGFFSQYFLLSLIGGTTFICIIKILWKQYSPPVLVFFMGLQWLQVFATIIYADFNQRSIDSLFSSRDTETLFIITFAQLTVMALVLNSFVFSKKNVDLTPAALAAAAAKINLTNVIIGYFIIAVLWPIIIAATVNNATLYQLAMSLGIFKSFFSALLLFILFVGKTRHNRLIVIILLIDFVLSFASFFSDFRIILLMVIVVYFTVNPSLKTRSILLLAPFVLVFFLIFSIWSYVKGDYRTYLNKGQLNQNVSVNTQDALDYILGRFAEADKEIVSDGAVIMLSRLQYMERYSEVYMRVPRFVAHADGKELENALNFLLVPRFINPNKGIKDASIKTSYYTGRAFSGANRGTSISMGYFCDLYIDYGLYIMCIPLIGIALIFGIVYRWLHNLRGYNIVFVFALLISSFLRMGNFESDIIFFLGMLRNNTALLLIGSVTFIPFLHKMLVKN